MSDRKPNTIQPNVSLWVVKASIGKTHSQPVLTSIALVDSGCSSIMVDSTILSNQEAINKLDIITDSTLLLKGAFSGLAQDIKGYFYGYLILYDDNDEPYPIHSKIFIAQGLSYPIFLGLNALKDSRFKAILPEGLLMRDPFYRNNADRLIPFQEDPTVYQITVHPHKCCVLRANTDTMVQTDFYIPKIYEPVRLAASNANIHGNDKFHTFQGTYEISQPGYVSILLQNFSNEDIFLDTSVNIADLVHLVDNQSNKHLVFEINTAKQTITSSIVRPFVQNNILRHYPSITDDYEEYKSRSKQIIDDLNSKGYSQYTVTDAFQSSQDAHSFAVPQTGTKKQATEKEIFDLLPKSHLSQPQCTLLKKLISKYKDVFARDITELDKTHLVELSADLRPNIDLSRFALKLRDTPISYQDQLETILNQMIEADLIQPAEGIIRLITPIRLIPKKDPTKMRLINDVRITNAVCQRAADPGNESIINSLSQLHNAKVCSSLDLSNSFWQIGVDSFLQSLLAFYGPGRKLYQLKRAPMGFLNSSTALNACITRMKDIPVFHTEISKLFPQHKYKILKALTLSQAQKAVQPVQTQIIGKISPENTERVSNAVHTKLTVPEIMKTNPIAFRKDTIFKNYADDLNFFSKIKHSCCNKVLLDSLPQTSLPNDSPFVTEHSQKINDPTFYHHLAELELLLLKLQKANLKLSPAKTIICATSISILGFQWSLNTLSIEEKRLDGFKALKTPTTKSECRSLIGAYSFFRAFIPGFAKISKPINDLAHSKTAFKWDSKHQESKDLLYKTIRENSKLSLYDPSLPLHVHTDASAVSAGGFIAQPHGHSSLVLFNYSRIFTPAEVNSSTFRKEILSALYGLKSYDFLLKGAKEIVLFIDAKAITWLRFCKASDPYVHRLSSELSEYNITKIVSVPTVLHAPADYLSRMNKHADKIESKLGNNKSMSLYEAECLAQRIHFENNQEFTGNDLKHLMDGPNLPSILKKNDGCKKSREVKLSSNPKAPILPLTSKPRAIRAPLLTDRSLIKKDSPFMLPKYKRLEKQKLTKELRDAEAHLRKINKQIFDLDSGFKPKTTHLPTNALEQSTDLRRSRRVIRPPNRYGFEDEINDFQVQGQNDNSTHSHLQPRSSQVDKGHDGHQSQNSQTEGSPTHNLSSLSNNDPTQTQQNVSNTRQNIPAQTRMPSHEDEVIPSIEEIEHDDSYLDLASPDDENEVETNFTIDELLLNSKLITNGYITMKDFILEQDKDAYCKKLKQAVQKGNTHFVIKQNILCAKDHNDPQNLKLVLPKTLIQPLFNLIHFSNTLGHQNKNNMYRYIDHKYHIKGLAKLLRHFCSTCALCSVYSTKPMKDVIIGEETVMQPRRRWVADLFHVSFPHHNDTSNDYSFVLVCVDTFSQYAQLYPLRNKSSHELYLAFLKLFQAHSFPHSIKCDGECGLAAADLIDKFKSLGVLIHKGSPGHSRGQSLAERTIKNVKEIFRKLHRDNNSLDIHELLTFTATQVNTNINTRGISPEKLFFMQTLPSKEDLLQVHDDFINNPSLYQSTKQFIDDLISKRDLDRKTRREKLNLTRRNLVSYPKGSIVFVSSKNLITSHTGLRARFTGPYIILANENNYSYVLLHLKNKTVIKRAAEFIIPATNPLVKGLLSPTWDKNIKLNYTYQY